MWRAELHTSHILGTQALEGIRFVFFFLLFFSILNNWLSRHGFEWVVAMPTKNKEIHRKYLTKPEEPSEQKITCLGPNTHNGQSQDLN